MRWSTEVASSFLGACYYNWITPLQALRPPHGSDDHIEIVPSSELINHYIILSSRCFTCNKNSDVFNSPSIIQGSVSFHWARFSKLQDCSRQRFSHVVIFQGSVVQVQGHKTVHTVSLTDSFIGLLSIENY